MRALLAAIRCEKGDVDSNLATHLAILAEAASERCDLALFPEMSLTGSADPGVSPERLVPLDHPAVAALTRATDEHHIGACFGIAERAPDGSPHINQVFAGAGRMLGIQRKRHLGDGEESFTAAAASAVFAWAGALLGIAICAESGFDAPFDAAAKTTLAKDFGNLPLSFEINKGQIDPSVKFLSHGPGYDLFLRRPRPFSECKSRGRQR